MKKIVFALVLTFFLISPSQAQKSDICDSLHQQLISVTNQINALQASLQPTPIGQLNPVGQKAINPQPFQRVIIRNQIESLQERQIELAQQLTYHDCWLIPIPSPSKPLSLK